MPSTRTHAHAYTHMHMHIHTCTIRVDLGEDGGGGGGGDGGGGSGGEGVRGSSVVTNVAAGARRAAKRKEKEEAEVEREPEGRFAPCPHAESRAEELGKFKLYVPEANLNGNNTVPSSIVSQGRTWPVWARVLIVSCSRAIQTALAAAPFVFRPSLLPSVPLPDFIPPS